jgi:hypothetical protein
MANEPIKNEDNLMPFSGELEFEDLEFLSEQQAEMIVGGCGLPPAFVNVLLPADPPAEPPPFFP